MNLVFLTATARNKSVALLLRWSHIGLTCMTRLSVIATLFPSDRLAKRLPIQTPIHSVSGLELSGIARLIPFSVRCT